MKPFTWPEKIAAGVIVCLAIGVFAWLIHRDGEKKGALLQEIKASAVVVTAARSDVKVEALKSATKKAEYHAARAKVVLQGDTVIADGKSIDLPSVANLIRVADARGAQDSTSMAKQNLLVGALDHHVDLVQELHAPRFGTKTGIAIGVVATVGVTYLAVKIIRAVAHK